MSSSAHGRWGIGAVVALTVALALGAAGTEQGASIARGAGAHATVAIKGFEFKPFKVTVSRGAKVTFVNRDSAAHRPAKKGGFDAGRIASGKAASVKLTKPGTYKYICTIHPFMRGKIVVTG